MLKKNATVKGILAAVQSKLTLLLVAVVIAVACGEHVMCGMLLLSLPLPLPTVRSCCANRQLFTNVKRNSVTYRVVHINTNICAGTHTHLHKRLYKELVQ